MFQVEPVLWLQSFASPFTVWLMSTVTWLGTMPCLAAIVFLLAFGVRYRVGLAILFLLSANSLATDLTKDAFALPRPGDVDTRVRQLGGDSAHPIAERGGAAGLFAPLPEATRAAARETTGLSYAFPSGHITSAATLVLSLALLLRSRRLAWLAAIWLPLTGLSRLFLGRHFIADLFGGLLLGGIVALGGALLFGKRALGLDRGAAAPWRRAAVVALAALALLLAVLVPGLDVATVGRLVAAVILLYVASPLRFPEESAEPLTRFLRTAIAAALCLTAVPALSAAFGALGLAGTPRAAMLQGAILVLVGFGGGAVVARIVPFAGGGRITRQPVGEA